MMRMDLGELIVPGAVLGGLGYLGGYAISGRKAAMGAGAMGAVTGVVGAMYGQAAKGKGGDTARRVLQAVDVTRDPVADQSAAADAIVVPNAP